MNLLEAKTIALLCGAVASIAQGPAMAQIISARPHTIVVWQALTRCHTTPEHRDIAIVADDPNTRLDWGRPTGSAATYGCRTGVLEEEYHTVTW